MEQQPATTTDMPDASSPTSGNFEILRTLLLQTEQTRIQRLEDILLDPVTQSHHLGKHLIDALYVAAKDQARLIEALREPALESIAVSSQCDRERVAHALAPVIRPAIQRAIFEALNGFLQSIDEITQRSLSLDGLRWRWEATRTGVPFRQVVLNRTLKYVVEQVYLIQKPAGLLAAHLVHPDLKTTDVDKDAVAGMLMAIQAFVRDSAFASSSERVESIELHGKTVMVCHGMWALLACVIRGVPPPQLREEIQMVLDEVHKRNHHALREYDGDEAKLIEPRPLLGKLLQKEAIQVDRIKIARPGIASSVLLLAMLSWLINAIYGTYQHHDEENLLKSALTNVPSALITEVQLHNDTWHVRGMIDPLAKDDAVIAASAHVPLNRLKLDLVPYISLDPELSLKRIAKTLQLPSSVAVNVFNERILLLGSASQLWLNEAKLLVSVLPHGDAVDFSNITVANPENPRLNNLIAAIGSIKIYFSDDTTLISDSLDRLNELKSLAKQLVVVTKGSSVRSQILITGQVDGVGSGRTNEQLKQARADAIKSELVAAGLDGEDVVTETGNEKIDGLDTNQRRVDVSVKILPQ